MTHTQPRMLTVGEVVLKSQAWLEARGVDSPRLDAELLLGYVLECDRLRLYLDWHKPLYEMELAAYRELVRQRGQERVPVARLLGKKEFYGRMFSVEAATFVPRPETEGLVERALTLLETELSFRGVRPTVLEVGTGTGAIILSIAAERPECQFIATDISEKALAVAAANARALHLESDVAFRAGSLLAGYEGAIHVLVSNPPYIPSAEIPGLPPEVRTHDPMTALDGGPDGLAVVRDLVGRGATHIVPGGWLLMEIGEGEGAGCLALLEGAGAYEQCRVENDPAGLERFVVARRKTGE